MPKTPDVFGPISAETTVAGNTATVSFQAVGGAKRITNLFARVSTSVLQSTCSLYVGVVSDLKRVYVSQSGSTGFTARGNIDLQDGEILYVVWSGADNGATALATFTGHNINFGEIGASSITGEDPIAAGDGSLIFPAIKSPDYSTGVSGWRIARDGTVEFNNGVFRGTLEAGNGTVNITANNLHVIGSQAEYFVGASEAFKARLIANDGSYFQAGIATGFFGDSFGGGIFLHPTSPSANGNSIDTARIVAEYDQVGGTDRPLLAIHSPNVSAPSLLEQAVIDLFGQTSTSATDDSQINLDANTVNAIGNFIILNNDGGRGVVSSGGINAASGAIGNTETDLYTCSSFTFKAERAYACRSIGQTTVSVAANRALFRLRKSSGGTQIVQKSVYNGVANLQNVADWAGFFYVTGSDVTCSPVVSVIGSATFTVTALATFGTIIEDIGPASRVSAFAFQLT